MLGILGEQKLEYLKRERPDGLAYLASATFEKQGMVLTFSLFLLLHSSVSFSCGFLIMHVVESQCSPKLLHALTCFTLFFTPVFSPCFILWEAWPIHF